MDNASIHKKLDLQNPKPHVIYTPPYSPEFNPIELAFAHVKRAFRTLNLTENNTSVADRIETCLNMFSVDHAKNIFTHVYKNFIASG